MDSPLELGLAAVVQEILHVKLNKDEIFSDWGARILTYEQTSAAANDAVIRVNLFLAKRGTVVSSTVDHSVEELMSIRHRRVIYNPDMLSKSYRWLVNVV